MVSLRSRRRKDAIDSQCGLPCATVARNKKEEYMSDPVMLFERVIDNFEVVKDSRDGTLYAFKFPWSFAKGAKVRLMSADKAQYLDCPVTGCYKRLVKNRDWSIEIVKEGHPTVIKSERHENQKGRIK